MDETPNKVVGSMIEVWWPDDKKFYKAIIDSYDPDKDGHKVVYVDGVVEILNLNEERWRLVNGKKNNNDPEDSKGQETELPRMHLKRKIEGNYYLDSSSKAARTTKANNTFAVDADAERGKKGISSSSKSKATKSDDGSSSKSKDDSGGGNSKEDPSRASAIETESSEGTQTPPEEMKKHVKVTGTVTVEVDSYKEIDDVKDIFCEHEDIGINLQNVFFTKRNFENGQALDYERKDGSSVHMNLHLGVRMQILIKVSWSAKLIPLDVHSWDTIHDVKTKFQGKEGTPANQLSLIYRKQLEDFQTLEAYHIYNGCVVYAISLGEDKFEISIKMPEGETVQLEVKLCSSVENVKTMLQCMMGFPIDHQNLIFNGPSLKNNKILADYKIQKNSALYFTFLVPGVINITVKTLTGRIIIVYVNIADTIYDLKTKVTYKEGIPVDRQRLIFGGKQLEDERTVGECKIQKGCTVDLLLRLCGC